MVDGTDPEEAAWARAGLLDTDDGGTREDRLAVLRLLTDRGATIDEMVEAHLLGSLPAVAGDLVRRRSVTTVRVDELAASCGVPLDLVERVFLAAGLPVRHDTEVPERLAVLVGAFESGAALMGEEAILAFTRVLGAAAANIAEAAIALFYAELGPGTAREGEDEVTRAALSEAATLAFASVPDVLSSVLLARFDRTSRRAIQYRGWSLRSGDGPDPAVDGPAEIVALGFVDLVGSTSWAEELNLRDHSLALSRFESAAWSSAVLAGGRVVKTIGDEAFFSAPTVDVACRIASELCAAAAADPVLPSARAAVGVGVVSSREGDYFGPLVNQVARMVKAAEPGELAVTADAADELPPERWEVRQRDPVALRGVAAPVSWCSVTPIG